MPPLRPNLLLISQLDMMRGGNQVLAASIRGYVRAGFHVHFITSRWAFGAHNRADYRAVLGECSPHVTVYPASSLLPARVQQWRCLRRTAAAGRFNFDPEFHGDFLTGGEYTTGLRELFLWLRLCARQMAVVISRLRDVPFDLVGGYEVYGAGAAFLCSRWLRKPLFTKFQGTILYPHLQRGPAWRLLPGHWLSLRLPAQAIFMTNDGTRGDAVLRQLGQPAHRVHFWLDGVREAHDHPPIDRCEFLARELKLAPAEAERTVLLLSASVLTYWKRVDRLITAVAELRDVQPPVHLAVAGHGSTREALQQLAEALGVARQVHFLETVSHDRMQSFMTVADIYLSAFDQSNLSNGLMEAMRAGKCIVTLADGSHAGLLRDGENAILIPLRAVKAGLTEALHRLMNDPALRGRLGAAAAQTARDRLWNWKARMQAEAEVLTELLHHSHHSKP